MAGIGPNLPPNFSTINQINDNVNADLKLNKGDYENKTESKTKANIYGPVLPASVLKKGADLDDDVDDDRIVVNNDESDDVDTTNITKYRSKQAKLYGPMLPPGLNDYFANSNNCSEQDKCIETVKVEIQEKAIGPSLSEEDSDEEVIGPLPQQATKTEQYEDFVRKRRHEFDNRANVMKHSLTKAPDTPAAPKRDSWMTELPPEIGLNIGITARKFKSNSSHSSSDGDRSVWTDTPADRIKKTNKGTTSCGKGAAKERIISKRELEMQEQVEQYNSQKRGKSLMEIHEDERKRQKISDNDDNERRPFDRDMDLGISKIDSKARASMVKQAKGMNMKFQAGKFESTFL